MIRHPSRRYILYLISRRCFDALTIVNTLRELALPVPPQQVAVEKVGFLENPEWRQFVDSIRKLQSTMAFPARYNPRAPEGSTTLAFLDSMKIQSMWNKDPFVCAASDIVSEPLLKRHLEIMLLGPLSYESIARRMANRFTLPMRAMNPRVVQAYAHYYWDFTALDRADWEAIIEWMPGRNMDYLVSLNAPRTTYGAALSTWMADGGVTPLKDTHAIRAMRDESFRHFMQASTMYAPGWKTSQAMRDYFQTWISAQEAIEMRQGGTAEVLEELRRIEADYDRDHMPTINELPAGSISSIDAHGEVVEDDTKEKK